jgi:hypothetical protein
MAIDDEAIVTQAWVDNKTVLELFKAKAWKIYKSKNKEGEVSMMIIFYFSSQNLLLDVLSLRLLAKTREFQHAKTAKTAKTRFRQTTKNAEMPKLPKLPKLFRRFGVVYHMTYI